MRLFIFILLSVAHSICTSGQQLACQQSFSFAHDRDTPNFAEAHHKQQNNKVATGGMMVLGGVLLGY